MNTCKAMLRGRSGFTLVEAVIVIAVIGIIVAVGFGTNALVQQNARNGQRSTSATAIADALEKYFEEHGEYPGCDTITSLTADSSAFKSLDRSTLVAPNAPSGEGSSLKCAEPDAGSDIFAYKGDDGAACTSGNMCTRFTLRYREEGSGNIITITGKREAKDLGPVAPVDPGGIVVVNVDIIGSDAVGTGSGATCGTGATVGYQLRYHANEDDWSSWQDGVTRNVAATQGHEYTFQTRARCTKDALSSDWVTSPVTAAIRPVTAPTSLTMAAAMNGTDARGTVGGGSCASGTTLKREIQYESTNTTTPGSWSSWDEITSSTRDVAAEQGYRYTFQQRARCEGLKVSSDWTESATANTVRGINTPSAPAFTVTGTTASTTTYTATGVSCPTGTSLMYNSRFYHDGGWTGAWYETASNVVQWNGNVDQGYNWQSQIQARCYTAHTTSGWSGVASAGWVRPIDTPGGAWGWNFWIAGNRRSWSYSWSAPACGPGTRQEYRYNSYVGPPGQWWWAGGGNYLGWNSHQWWAPTMDFFMSGSLTVPYGKQAQNAVQYICVNTVTGRKSNYGPESWSPVYGT